MFRAAEASTKNSLVRVWVEAVFVDPGSLLFGVKTVKVVVDGFVVGGGVVVVGGGFVVGAVVVLLLMLLMLMMVVVVVVAVVVLLLVLLLVLSLLLWLRLQTAVKPEMIARVYDARLCVSYMSVCLSVCLSVYLRCCRFVCVFLCRAL